MEITHQRIFVSDFSSMINFYQDILGLESQFVDNENLYAQFSLGEIILAFYSKTKFKEYTGLDLEINNDKQYCQNIILNVKNVDRLIEKLKSLGVDVVQNPEDHPEWTRRTAYIKDPEGNLLELGEYI